MSHSVCRFAFTFSLENCFRFEIHTDVSAAAATTCVLIHSANRTGERFKVDLEIYMFNIVKVFGDCIQVEYDDNA